MPPFSEGDQCLSWRNITVSEFSHTACLNKLIHSIYVVAAVAPNLVPNHFLCSNDNAQLFTSSHKLTRDLLQYAWTLPCEITRLRDVQTVWKKGLDSLIKRLITADRFDV